MFRLRLFTHDSDGSCVKRKRTWDLRKNSYACMEDGGGGPWV